MNDDILSSLPDRLDEFLAGWTRHMGAAGYLEHTTAKREDCIRSFEWLVSPMLEALARRDEPPSFAELIREKGWCERLVNTSRRHRFRGVTSEMFLGCFKTLVHAIEELIVDGEGRAEDKLVATRRLRRFADAYETVLVGDWAALSQQEAGDRLDRSNRLLTLEKNKYENILASISDMVVVTDGEGAVVEANASARAVFGDALVQGMPAWRAIGLEGGSMAEMLTFYPPQASHEISLDRESRFLELKIVPLSLVSLASRGYILVLVDITSHVRQREILERTVAERTEALRREKAQLEEMNITLRHVMNSVEGEREDQRKAIARTVETVLLPAIERVRGEDDARVRKGYADILEDQLLRLAPGTGGVGDARMLKLTPTEMRICRFIQAGTSSKDIAESLNLSLGTVQTHRKNIRRKLDIQGSDVNLYTFLLSGGARLDPERS